MADDAGREVRTYRPVGRHWEPSQVHPVTMLTVPNRLAPGRNDTSSSRGGYAVRPGW
jgi:hypothetical protein